MVSFSCEACGDVLTKGKLDKHVNRCRGASFTCIDCMTTFPGYAYKSHTSCMTEAQKYEGQFYKEKEQKGKRGKNKPTGEMIPRKAYIEDDNGDMEMGDAHAVAVIDVPPKAPSPPRTSHTLPPGVNVFDYLVKDDGPSQSSSTAAMYGMSQGEADPHFASDGYAYGATPIQSSLRHQHSMSSLAPQAGSQVGDSTAYLTPGPSRARSDMSREEKKSDKKRKRQQVEDVDTVKARQDPRTIHKNDRPSLHSGLTGGLNKLLSRPEDDERLNGMDRSPLSPKKRSKKDDRRSRDGIEEFSSVSKTKPRKDRRRDSDSSDDATRLSGAKGIQYHDAAKAQPNGQVVPYHNPAELFLSFITKGPDSDKGMSLNKVLKRYHRERGAESEKDKESNDKELWKELRLRKNDRGEIVLFM